ncbi:MAG: ATP-dependent helicase [Deltaproteobacteria bacterium]|nr:ATP-dependent helicase [Deltaproteobacteria bacterium]
MIQYDKELNESQYEAVFFQDGPCLVIAGAGSGKTRALVYRVARMVEDGVPPNNILLLTFTRRSAQEMLNRAGQLIDHELSDVSGGTFHATANACLRRYSHAIGLPPNFVILDQADMESAISQFKPSMSRESKVRLPKTRTVVQIVSKCRNLSLSLNDVLKKEFPQFFPVLDQLETIYDQYARYKRDSGLLDYDDLLVMFKQMLEENETVRSELSGRFRYIMVDEYQDTNLLQAAIVKQLSSVHNNVLVVGDDSQSIYSFRGATFKNIMNFPQEFPGAKVIKLEQNYRSSQPILNLTNQIISSAQNKYTKCLYTTRKTGARPILVECRTENDQSQFVVRRIQELKAQGLALSEMAVLFRAGFHSFDLEVTLDSQAIPFTKYGGFKFVESAHIKDIVSFLRILENSSDALSLNRVLLMLDKVGPKKSRDMINFVSEEGRTWRQLKDFPAKGVTREGLFNLVETLEAAAKPGQSLPETLDSLMSFYGPVLEERYDDFPKRYREIEQLKTIMTRYRSLEHFLADITLDPPSSQADLMDRRQNRANLTLSTIHSAKGLEWGVVFIIWAQEGYFPPQKCLDNADSLEEERRLMYVAATRAKDYLFITYPDTSGHAFYGNFGSGPSRFVSRAPRDILDRQDSRGRHL